LQFILAIGNGNSLCMCSILLINVLSDQDFVEAYYRHMSISWYIDKSNELLTVDYVYLLFIHLFNPLILLCIAKVG
jgi:hypothetical protein